MCWEGHRCCFIPKEIAGAFVCTRSTCDDKQELLSVSQRYKASGKDRCHPESRRDSAVVHKYASRCRADIVCKDALMPGYELLTDKWVWMHGKTFRRVAGRQRPSEPEPQCSKQRAPKALRIEHAAALKREWQAALWMGSKQCLVNRLRK